MQAISGRQMVGILLVCSMTWAGWARSATLTVDPQGSGFTTIQQALDAAAVGDTVQLVDGTYTGDGNISVNFHFRATTLCSMNGPANCIMDCQGYSFAGAPRGVVKGITVLNCAETVVDSDRLTLEDCVFQAPSPSRGRMLYLAGCRPTLVNCTFRGFSEDDGGAIMCRGASPTIRRCTFENNSAWQDGGAIHNRFGSSPVITGCRFVNNSCKDDGGAIANYDASHPVIVDCTFERNRSNDNGGAIFSRSGSCPRIVSCTFAGNTARANGGALCNRENAAVIVNCVFTGNSAYNNGGALYCEQVDELPTLLNCTLVGNSAGLEGGVLYIEDREPASLLNCILWANRDDTGDSETSQVLAAPILRHCCVQNWTGQWGGPGNSGQDPQFVDADGPDNVAGTADDNLRLTATSPCYNAGLTEMVSDPFRTDRDGNPRIMGRLMDIGAYEYVVPPDVVTIETPTYPRLDEDIIIINEAKTVGNDWVELHNLTDRTVHLDGWLLSDEVATGLYEFAAGTVIEPHGYLVLYRDQHFANPADPGCLIAFGLNREGEILYLRSGYGGLPTGLRQEQVLENFTNIGASETLGRYTNSDGTTDFVRLSVPTPGAANAHPWVGPVIISEILDCYDSLGRTLAFIELYNGSNASAQVSILVGDAADPIFTQDPVTVPAQSRVLLTDRPDLVQAAYGSIIPPGVEILRVNANVTWSGYNLGLSLRQGFITYDTVTCRYGWLGYGSWPKAATGEALSVTRIDPTRYGNDPDNWQAAPPSPGK